MNVKSHCNAHNMQRRRRTLASLAAALVLILPAAALADCGIQVMELPVKMVGTRAIATVEINGEPVPLMVDSGAFFSMLTEGAAMQLKLPVHELPDGLEVRGLVGKVDAKATTVDHLRLQKGDIPNVDFIVGGNEPGAGAMGMLGRNVLSFIDIEYDLANGLIRFVLPNDGCDKANMAYWAGKTPVSVIDLLSPIADSTPAVLGEIRLNGQRTTALFDTGATTIVSLRAARRAGVKEADMTPIGRMTGAGHGQADSWTAPFQRVELGGEAVLNNQLDVGDFSMDDAGMLVGIDFFLSHRIYISNKQLRMFFTYNGGPVFARNVAVPVASASAAAGAGSLTADELARRGAASLTRGDLAAALDDLDLACALEPGNASFFATRAQVHRQRQDYDRTMADLDTALQLAPTLGEARMARAWQRFGHRDRDLALGDLAELDRTLPPQAPSRSDMARLYEALGLPAQVIAQLNLWIDAHPHDRSLESAWNARCWARMELNADLDRAMDDCNKAVNANENNASYLDSRAWVWLRLGKPEKALDDFDLGLSIFPSDVWSLYGRGEAYLILGDVAQGRADLAAARATDAHIDEKIMKAGMPTAADAPAK